MIKLATTNALEATDLKTAYMNALIAAAEENPAVVDVEADLGNVIGGPDFRKRFPDRFFDIGIAEQSLSSISAGLSAVGKVPFCHSFASFASRRMCDQNYISCAYGQNNVKIVGSDPAISSGENGGTHQANEDLALFRPISGITIVEPSDSTQMAWAVREAARTRGVFYIRVQRVGNVKIYEEGSTFEFGRANVVREGGDLTLIATGNLMLKTCLEAREILAAEGVSARVVDMFTVKPIDSACVLKCARETGAIVTCENHSIVGGLGSAVAEVLAEGGCAAPLRRIGVQDRFGEVGTPDELQRAMKMTKEDVAEAARKALAVKKIAAGAR